ncbi:class I SAM-dependent methyltransferase [Methanomethylovorans sp.]|uniref:class I SAM-dependent methyltransferase n=1 Tax=Methanomethylovorans sp. TaxID=2758717 RepID=UPI00351BF04A
MEIHRYLRRKWRAREDLSYPIICPRGGRPRLAEVFRELGYLKGVEIGTRKGDFSKVLCESIPNLQLTCVDPWTAFRKVTQEQQDDYYKKAYEALAPFNVRLLKMTSMRAVETYEDNSIDFAFVDGSHDFDDAMMDIILWSRKVRVGGIMAVHDYSMFPDVVRAVNAYVASHKIAPWYLVREYESTVFWVKS